MSYEEILSKYDEIMEDLAKNVPMETSEHIKSKDGHDIILAIKNLADLQTDLTNKLIGIESNDSMVKHLVDLEVTLVLLKRVYGISDDDIKSALLDRLDGFIRFRNLPISPQ